jgi:hypothetical protein
MTFVFKHPKFYRIPRDKSDQVISGANATAKVERAPGPGQSSKPQASSKVGSKASSLKQQATSVKRQAVRDD